MRALWERQPAGCGAWQGAVWQLVRPARVGPCLEATQRQLVSTFIASCSLLFRWIWSLQRCAPRSAASSCLQASCRQGEGGGAGQGGALPAPGAVGAAARQPARCLISVLPGTTSPHTTHPSRSCCQPCRRRKRRQRRVGWAASMPSASAFTARCQTHLTTTCGWVGGRARTAACSMARREACSMEEGCTAWLANCCTPCPREAVTPRPPAAARQRDCACLPAMPAL